MKIKDFLDLSLREIEELIKSEKISEIEYSKARRDRKVIKKGSLPLGFQVVSDRKLLYISKSGEDMVSWAFYAPKSDPQSSLSRRLFSIELESGSSIIEVKSILLGPKSFSDDELDKDKSIRYYLEEARKKEK